MKLWRNAWAIVGKFRRPYVILNAAYYGLVVCGMVYVAFNPALQQSLIEMTGQTFTEGPLSAVGAAYGGGRVLPAIALTFVINLLIGSLASITLPSLVIPFSGLLLGTYRAVMWGLILSPTTPELRIVMIPHSLTLLLEGQAYVLTMLAAFAQGRALLWPRSVGAANRRQGYVSGLKRTAQLYPLVIILLAIAAIYEAVTAALILRWIG